MMIKFQFLPTQDIEHDSTVEVTPDVLDSLIKQANSLINNDPAFRDWLKEHGRDVEKGLSAARKIAAQTLRRRISGKKFSGPAALAKEVLGHVISAQLKVMMGIEDVHPDIGLTSKRKMEELEDLKSEGESIGFKGSRSLLKTLIESGFDAFLDEFRKSIREHFDDLVFTRSLEIFKNELEMELRNAKINRYEFSRVLDVFDRLSRREIDRDLIINTIIGLLNKASHGQLKEVRWVT